MWIPVASHWSFFTLDFTGGGPGVILLHSSSLYTVSKSWLSIGSRCHFHNLGQSVCPFPVCYHVNFCPDGSPRLQAWNYHLTAAAVCTYPSSVVVAYLMATSLSDRALRHSTTFSKSSHPPNWEWPKTLTGRIL